MNTKPSEEILLNIAHIWSGSGALGPGLRSIVWVQGCSHHCPGCISPEWIPQVDAWWVRPQELAPLLLKNPNVTGLTFSGGEPMDQAAGLSALVQLCRQIRDVNVICFSGYTYEQLLSHPEDSVVHALLAEIDVLIDGPYIEALNDDLGLRGSSNQRVIHLSDKLKGFDLDHAPRHIELFIKQDSTMMIGVPPREVLSALEHTFDGHNRRDGK